MRGADDFDAFYRAARERILLQAYALTGDLPAARSAVRDAFVAAWHHWPKVSRREDPEAWVRPVAWQHAQRRHSARIWHRDRTLDDASRATLEALGRLSPGQRRALLLTQLAGLTLESMARELALTDEAASTTLQTATSRFAVMREVPAESVRQHLAALAPRVADTQLPRPSIVRRAGAARRRTHTGVGIAAALAALLLSGAVVQQGDGAPTAASPGTGGRTNDSPPIPELSAADLLDRKDLRPVAGSRRVRVARTNDNTVGDGIQLLCQRERFADPDGIAALVRRFEVAGDPRTSALQVVELSRSEEAAQATFDRTVGWYADCQELRVQLLSVHRLRGVGDEATIVSLRSWERPVTTYTLATARTGELVTTTASRVRDDRAPRPDRIARVAARAVAELCTTERGGSCVDRPRAVPTSPPPAASEPGMLQVADLPPIPGLSQAWVGTRPRRPRVNAAATRCDHADFTSNAVVHARTRSFLVPEAKVPATFGLTETVGRFRKPAAAREFVDQIRRRMARCEDQDLATSLALVHDHRSRRGGTAIWRVTTEVSDERSVTFHMSLTRRGDTVAQLGFVPAPDHQMRTGDFHALTDRAAERLASLPRT